jgi:hypothetical protein
LTRDFVPRRSFNFGFNGQLSQDTTFNITIAADRMPLLFGIGSPWTTRSMVQVTRAFSTGAARVTSASAGFAAAVARERGTGTIVGRAYTDWNGNSTQDPDEEPLENIPVRITGVGSVTTRRDGEYAFLDVPTGPQQVGLDTAAVPIDFDPPAISAIDIELDRGSTRRVSFGLIPLGSVHGRVIRDANGNGKVDPGEEPVNGAVLVLDRGSRSEEVRRGPIDSTRFAAAITWLSLVRESLPEGAVITSATEVPVALKRHQLTADIDFLVIIEKRPERARSSRRSPGSRRRRRLPGARARQRQRRRARPPGPSAASPVPTTAGKPRRCHRPDRRPRHGSSSRRVEIRGADCSIERSPAGARDGGDAGSGGLPGVCGSAGAIGSRRSVSCPGRALPHAPGGSREPRRRCRSCAVKRLWVINEPPAP